MKIKTSELTGAALDWAVAKCEGMSIRLVRHSNDECLHPMAVNPSSGAVLRLLQFSESWAQGGPIIEREQITVGPWDTSPFMAHKGTAHWGRHATRYIGPSPLIAAMRCYVASKLGDEVEIPKELFE